MTEKDFVVWLHGYLEISGVKTLGEQELQVIKDHLNKFFIKVTPDRQSQKNVLDKDRNNYPARPDFQNWPEWVPSKGKNIPVPLPEPPASPPWSAPYKITCSGVDNIKTYC
jgi:hypothetical protein